MLGTVIQAPSARAPGWIATDTGERYSFTTGGWRNQRAGSAAGMRVEFEAMGKQAFDVRPAPAATPSPNRGGGGKSPAKAGARPATGSIWSAMRSMAAIFILTPLSLPLIFVLPLMGKIEVLTMVLSAGFIGGSRAGSIKAALLAASLVGGAYGAVVFMMVQAVLQLAARLPAVGVHLETGLNAIGGIGIATGLIAGTATFPFVLLLLISGSVGALTSRR